MNREEKINLAIKKRKEIEKLKKEYQEKMNKLEEEYEMLGDYAAMLLREEEKSRKKRAKEER